MFERDPPEDRLIRELSPVVIRIWSFSYRNIPVLGPGQSCPPYDHLQYCQYTQNDCVHQNATVGFVWLLNKLDLSQIFTINSTTKTYYFELSILKLSNWRPPMDHSRLRMKVSFKRSGELSMTNQVVL